MDREETQKAIEVMQAYVDGEQIEIKATSGWIREFNPLWTWSLHCQYRVKPKPRFIWVACGTDADYTSSLTWATEDACNSAYQDLPGDGWKAVKFVEVIE